MLPEPVFTIIPGFAPRRTGDVVISVPFRKLFAPKTRPVKEPSAFCVKLFNTGTLGSTFGAGGFFAFTAPPPPNIERVGDFFGAAFTGVAFFAITVFFFTAVDLDGVTGVTFFSEADALPNNENAGFFGVVGVGVTAFGAGAFFTAGLLPNIESVGDFFLTGAGVGAAATLGGRDFAGLRFPKIERVGDFFATGAGFAAAGFGAVFVDVSLAGLPPPKIDRVGDFFAGAFGLKLPVDFGVLFFSGAGAAFFDTAGLPNIDFFATGFTFGAGVGAGLGFDFAGAAPKIENVGEVFLTRSGSGTGSGSCDTLAGALPKMENVGEDFFTGSIFAGSSSTSSFFGVGLPKKKKGAGAGLDSGTGAGVGATFGSSFFCAGVPKEKKDAGAAFGVGVATGFTSSFTSTGFFSSFSPIPKKEVNASVTGSAVPIEGSTAFALYSNSSGLGSGSDLTGEGEGLKKLNVLTGSI